MNMVAHFPNAFEGLVIKELQRIRQHNHYLRSECNAQERRIDRTESMLQELIDEVKKE